MKKIKVPGPKEESSETLKPVEQFTPLRNCSLLPKLQREEHEGVVKELRK
jgi:hypothetical protein